MRCVVCAWHFARACLLQAANPTIEYPEIPWNKHKLLQK
jgi:hypothetical protein